MSDLDTIRYCPTPGCPTPPEPEYADRGLCTPCEYRGIEALDNLPKTHHDLLQQVTEKPVTGRTGNSGKPGPTEEYNLGIDALAGEIHYAVAQWAEIVRDRAVLSRGRPPSVADACETLAAWWSVWLACPPWPVAGYDHSLGDLDGPSAIVWVTRLYRRAGIILGDTALTIELPGICPSCRRPALRHVDGADTMWCHHCRQRWTWAEYALHVDLITVGVVRE